jgi:hypothetical protein
MPRKLIALVAAAVVAAAMLPGCALFDEPTANVKLGDQDARRMTEDELKRSVASELERLKAADAADQVRAQAETARLSRQWERRLARQRSDSEQAIADLQAQAEDELAKVIDTFRDRGAGRQAQAAEISRVAESALAELARVKAERAAQWGVIGQMADVALPAIQTATSTVPGGGLAWTLLAPVVAYWLRGRAEQSAKQREDKAWEESQAEARRAHADSQLHTLQLLTNPRTLAAQLAATAPKPADAAKGPA